MDKLTRELAAAGASSAASPSAAAGRGGAASAFGAWRMRNARFAPYLMLVFALIGIADAGYVARASYTGLPMWCALIDGCNIVAQSPYARIFGVPLSYLGLVFYLYMFGFAALLVLDPLSRGLRLGAVLYTALGVSYSLYSLYVQVASIRALCIYCLISAVLTFLLHLAALWNFNATRVASAVR